MPVRVSTVSSNVDDDVVVVCNRCRCHRCVGLDGGFWACGCLRWRLRAPPWRAGVRERHDGDFVQELSGRQTTAAVRDVLVVELDVFRRHVARPRGMRDSKRLDVFDAVRSWRMHNFLWNLKHPAASLLTKERHEAQTQFGDEQRRHFAWTHTTQCRTNMHNNTCAQRQRGQTLQSLCKITFALEFAVSNTCSFMNLSNRCLYARGSVEDNALQKGEHGTPSPRVQVHKLDADDGTHEHRSRARHIPVPRRNRKAFWQCAPTALSCSTVGGCR